MRPLTSPRLTEAAHGRTWEERQMSQGTTPSEPSARTQGQYSRAFLTIFAVCKGAVSAWLGLIIAAAEARLFHAGEQALALGVLAATVGLGRPAADGRHEFAPRARDGPEREDKVQQPDGEQHKVQEEGQGERCLREGRGRLD
jgi:hypothetical protein